MNMINKILFCFVLFSCKKEVNIPEKQTCQCYESHYKIEPVLNNGAIILGWVWDFNTSEQTELCEKDTGSFIENGQGKKYKVVCK